MARFAKVLKELPADRVAVLREEIEVMAEQEEATSMDVSAEAERLLTPEEAAQRVRALADHVHHRERVAAALAGAGCRDGHGTLTRRPATMGAADL
jgi:hypothetical protein